MFENPRKVVLMQLYASFERVALFRPLYNPQLRSMVVQGVSETYYSSTHLLQDSLTARSGSPMVFYLTLQEASLASARTTKDH